MSLEDNAYIKYMNEVCAVCGGIRAEHSPANPFGGSRFHSFREKNNMSLDELIERLEGLMVYGKGPHITMNFETAKEILEQLHRLRGLEK